MSSEPILIHGGDIYTDRGLQPGEKLLDFSANLNPLGMPAAVREAAVRAISESEAYPDPLCRALRAEIAQKEGIPAEQIVCGNGAADLLYRLCWAYKPQIGLVPAPTFAEYELALKNSGAHVRLHPFSAENQFQPDDTFFTSITPETDVVFFCNPNNPTGLTVSRNYILKLAEICQKNNCLLIVDECFLCFADGGAEKSAVPLLCEFDNLFVLKAFTKLYAMAGLRLGYLLCGSTEHAQKIAASGQAWSVSTPAQAAGIAALQIPDYAEQTRNYLRGNRAFLAGVLRECGADVLDSEANYLFFRWNDLTLPEKMVKHRILIRSCANYHTLDETYYRIAVRNEEENRLFAKALRQIAGRKG